MCIGFPSFSGGGGGGAVKCDIVGLVLVLTFDACLFIVVSCFWYGLVTECCDCLQWVAFWVT